ncbi:MAG: hypothetical protein WCG85_17960 [Polyangia bacterium]
MFAVLRRYWPVLAATAVLLPHVRFFDFVTDDAYISFRYAANLAEHGQLVFNLGERVEGFTNFLWTVLLAAGIKLGLGPVAVSRFLGVAFGVGNLALVVRMSLRLSGQRPSAWHLVAPALLASMGAFACWCTGGLETQLFTFLSLLGFDLLLAEISSQRGFASAAVFALAAMTRPEGLLFFGLGGLFRLLTAVMRERRLRPRRDEWVWLALFAAIFVPYFAWRWRYYGWPFPNTFYVKSSGGAGTLIRGGYYLRRFAEDYGVPFFILLALLGRPAATDQPRRDLWRLTALVWLAFAVYVVKVGGDFMGLYRFILPVVPLGAVVVQESLRRLAQRLRPGVGTPVLVLAGAALAIAFLVGSLRVSRVAVTFIGADNGIDTPGYLKKYAEDRIPVGQWFAKNARADDLMTVGGAGVIPYYSGIPAYDVFGLVDAHIAHDPHMSASDRPGHQKWGSDQYMLSRHPTLITHRYCLPSPCFEEQSWTPPGYQWVRAVIPGPRPTNYGFLKRRDRP